MHFTGAKPSPQIILLNHDIRTQQIHAQLKNTSKVKQTSHHINKMFARPKKAKQHHTTKLRLNHQLRRSPTKEKEGNISTLLNGLFLYHFRITILITGKNVFSISLRQYRLQQKTKMETYQRDTLKMMKY